jgi:hypothetical protein
MLTMRYPKVSKAFLCSLAIFCIRSAIANILHMRVASEEIDGAINRARWLFRLFLLGVLLMN